MSHLVRAGLLLAVVVVGFWYARSLSAVISVEFIGITHTDNPREWAGRAVNNQDPGICTECHEPMNASWQGSAHSPVTCEDCHSATKSHIVKARAGQPAPLPLLDARDLCLTCHAKVAGRPAGFPQIDPARHIELLAGAPASCTLCHDPHNPGLPPEFTHSLDGRSACLACHGPKQWKPLPPDHEKRTQETCLTCHRFKEGR
jgi:hypothetical protein